jgi:hypothetical protein
VHALPITAVKCFASLSVLPQVGPGSAKCALKNVRHEASMQVLSVLNSSCVLSLT